MSFSSSNVFQFARPKDNNSTSPNNGSSPPTPVFPRRRTSTSVQQQQQQQSGLGSRPKPIRRFMDGINHVNNDHGSMKPAINRVSSKQAKEIESRNDGLNWDRQNQDKIRAMESSSSFAGDIKTLYEKLNTMREKERSVMEQCGLVDQQDTRKNLDEAINFVGTCNEMCPIFERVRREYENDVKQYERGESGSISANRAVKAFSRPAAGQPPPLPSDVRPPRVLESTLDYLINDIIPQLPDSHGFLWDRTRSIRQDFTYQNYTGPEAIDCNEKIVRIHILCLHIMAGSGVEYSRQQEIEQLNKALQTLTELYDDNNHKNCQNEPEFRAYQLLSHLRDSDIEHKIESLPEWIFSSDIISMSLRIRELCQQNNISSNKSGLVKNTEASLNLIGQFFKFLSSPQIPYLLSCLAEIHFNDIRIWAIKKLSKSFHKRGRPFNSDSLCHMLGFDSIDDLKTLCLHIGVNITDQGVELSSFSDQSVLSAGPRAQAYSEKIVEVKRNERPWQEFITTKQTIPSKYPPIDNRNIRPVLPTAQPHPAKDQIPQVQAPPVKKPEEKPTQPAFKFSVPRAATAPAPPAPQPVIEPQVSAPSPVVAAPKHLSKDIVSQLAQQELQGLVSDIVNKTVIKEAQIAIKNQQVTRQRQSFARQIFRALVHEKVYNVCLLAIANKFRDKCDYRFIIDRIIYQARRCKKLADYRKMRQQQLQEARLLMGRTWNYNHHNQNRAIQEDESRRQLLQDQAGYDAFLTIERERYDRLWKPIDLKRELLPPIVNEYNRTCGNGGGAQLCIIVSCQDWSYTTSKWIQRKLGLGLNGKMLSNQIKSANGLVVNLVSFDDAVNNQKQLRDTAALIFECGLTESDETDIGEKILSDGIRLYENVMKIVQETNFNLVILIVCWVPQTSINGNELANKLNLQDLTIKFPTIQFICLCEIVSIENTQLSESLNVMANNITFTKSPLGRKRQEQEVNEKKRKNILPPSTPLTTRRRKSVDSLSMKRLARHFNHIDNSNNIIDLNRQELLIHKNDKQQQQSDAIIPKSLSELWQLIDSVKSWLTRPPMEQLERYQLQLE